MALLLVLKLLLADIVLVGLLLTLLLAFKASSKGLVR